MPGERKDLPGSGEISYQKLSEKPKAGMWSCTSVIT